MGADIGEKPDIGGDNLRLPHNLRRYRRHIGADMTPISVFSPISVKKLTISVVATHGYPIIYADIGVISGPISAYICHIGADIGVIFLCPDICYRVLVHRYCLNYPISCHDVPNIRYDIVY